MQPKMGSRVAKSRGNYFNTHPMIVVPALGFFTLAPVVVVLALDRYSTFGLREYNNPQR